MAAHGLHNVPTSGAAQPFREMGELFPRWRAGAPEVLRLGVACSLNWGPLRQLVARFRATHPTVELLVEDLDEAGLAERLPARRIDVAIALEDAGAAGWRSAPLWSERLMAFMAEAHPLALENSVSPAALRATPILMAGNGAGDLALQRAIVRALGGPPTFLHYAVQRDNLIDLVGLGFGATLAGGSALGAFYPGVCARPVESPAARLDYRAYWARENDRPVMRAFLDAARGAGEAV